MDSKVFSVIYSVSSFKKHVHLLIWLRLSFFRWCYCNPTILHGILDRWRRGTSCIQKLVNPISWLFEYTNYRETYFVFVWIIDNLNIIWLNNLLMFDPWNCRRCVMVDWLVCVWFVCFVWWKCFGSFTRSDISRYFIIFFIWNHFYEFVKFVWSITQIPIS